jgi:protein translocase SecG subunit
MKEITLGAQIVLSTLIIGAILLQAQGSGLGTTWGGGGESYHTKRGIERVLFGFTIVGIVLFVVLSVANVLLLS